MCSSRLVSKRSDGESRPFPEYLCADCSVCTRSVSTDRFASFRRPIRPPALVYCLAAAADLSFRYDTYIKEEHEFVETIQVRSQYSFCREYNMMRLLYVYDFRSPRPSVPRILRDDDYHRVSAYKNERFRTERRENIHAKKQWTIPYNIVCLISWKNTASTQILAIFFFFCIPS